MDLSCVDELPLSEREEPIPEPLRAPDDPHILSDPRVLPNLLALETHHLPSCDYFAHVQDDVQPYMRKVVTAWMLEVCEEQSCEEQVFPLAVNYLDRYLSAQAITRNHLQLLASAALLVASKVRQTAPLPVQLLCAYTDNSITPDELRTREIILLHQLQWETSAVTAYDIVEHVLARVSRGDARVILRRHAHTLAAVCYTETEFMRMRPSLTATACVVVAARGLTNAIGGAAAAAELAARAAELTQVNTTALRVAAHHIEQLLAKEAQHTKSTSAPTTPTSIEDVDF